MEQVNRNESRSALIEKNLVDEAGTVNAFTVNCISGAHTWPLLSEIWSLYQNDVSLMEELQAFLKTIYEKEQYDILIGILKILYNCCWLVIPDDLQMIFDCEEKELKEIYLYEFLEDFQDIIYDLRTETELSENQNHCLSEMVGVFY
jgi:hypothetical protein